MSRLRKLDSNDPEITRMLREAGAVVWHLDCLEPGRPDKLVGFLGKLCLLEIKAPKTGRLSKEQKDARKEMARAGVRVHVVHTVREAFEAVGITGERAAQNHRALGELAANLQPKITGQSRLVPSRHNYRTPAGDPWADPGSASKIPDGF
jgi:hypothetical protein